MAAETPVPLRILDKEAALRSLVEGTALGTVPK
jgi:hypothetical protein